MFKRVLPVVGTLLIAFAILQTSVVRSSRGIRPSFAATSLKFSVSLTPVPSPSVQPPIQYYLVYPGMLPDHFFYKVKMVRDQVWIFLTTNSLKRSELMLLFADKRLGAGKVLIDGNKVPLGLSTIVKAEKYLERSVNNIFSAKEKGENISPFAGKLRLAVSKHIEVLTQIKEIINAEGKIIIDNELKLLKSLQEKAQNL